jgi:hypothetical protein
MGSHTAALITTVTERPNQSERRHGSRTPAIFSLLYSGMDSGQMLMGDGVVTTSQRAGSAFAGIDRSNPAWNWPSLSTFLEWEGLCALPRAESPGLQDVDLGWS